MSVVQTSSERGSGRCLSKQGRAPPALCPASLFGRLQAFILSSFMLMDQGTFSGCDWHRWLCFQNEQLRNTC